MANRQFEPDRRAEFGAIARSIRRGRRQVRRQNLGCRAAFAPLADEGCGHVVSTVGRDQGLCQIGLFARRLAQRRMVQQTGIVAGLHVIGGRRLDPFGHDLGALQQALRLLEFGGRDDQGRNALFASPTGPARAVQQGIRRARQIGVDHQFQTRQVNAACSDVGRHTDLGTAIAQGLQGVGAFGLRQLSRQGHCGKAAVGHAGKEVVHIGPGLAEDDRSLRLMEPQQVEDRMFAVTHGHRNRLILDVGVLLGVGLHLDAQGVLLIGPRQRLDLFWHGGREHQCAAFSRARAKDELQILLKAHVEHLVGFVQNDGADLFELQAAALDMVAQAARSADDDMHATVQHALFGAVVHAADAGGNLGIGSLVQPLELTRHLQRKFAGRRDDQSHRDIRIQKLIRSGQQFRGDGQAKGHGLARSGLRRDQKIAGRDVFGQHSVLNRRQGFIAFRRQRLRQRRSDGDIGHVCSQRGGLFAREVPCTAPLFPIMYRPPRLRTPWNPWADREALHGKTASV